MLLCWSGNPVGLYLTSPICVEISMNGNRHSDFMLKQRRCKEKGKDKEYLGLARCCASLAAWVRSSEQQKRGRRESTPQTYLLSSPRSLCHMHCYPTYAIHTRDTPTWKVLITFLNEKNSCKEKETTRKEGKMIGKKKWRTPWRLMQMRRKSLSKHKGTFPNSVENWLSV